ncbi:MAG: hypothetical protein KUG77_03290 [Nannocystaceae bacterium]|nr:hypothetical protein [Nannocystaceae bacterium]
MTRPESWQDSYRRNVALLEGVRTKDVQIVCCHNHVPLPGTLGPIETIVVELSVKINGETVTVYAWDDPPFFCVRKQPSAPTPTAALRFVSEQQHACQSLCVSTRSP